MHGGRWAALEHLCMLSLHASGVLHAAAHSLRLALVSQAQQAANDARQEGKRRVGPAADGAKQGVDQAQRGFEQGADQAAGTAAKQVCPGAPCKLSTDQCLMCLVRDWRSHICVGLHSHLNVYMAHLREPL